MSVRKEGAQMSLAIDLTQPDVVKITSTRQVETDEGWVSVLNVAPHGR